MWLFFTFVTLYTFVVTEYLLVSAFLFLLVDLHSGSTDRNPFRNHMKISICLAISSAVIGGASTVPPLAMLFALPTAAVSYAVLTYRRYRRIRKGLPDFPWLTPLSEAALKTRLILSVIAAVAAPLLVIVFAVQFYFELIHM